MSETSMIQRIEHVSNMLERHEHALNGNGKPGLVSDVHSLTTTVGHIEKFMEKMDSRTNRIERFMYLALGGVAVIEWYLKH